jgi:hypothetical protein
VRALRVDLGGVKRNTGAMQWLFSMNQFAARVSK